jgi:hypothetical protein
MPREGQSVFREQRRSVRSRRRIRLLTAILAAGALTATTAAGAASAVPRPDATSLQVVDDCGGQCYDILPPGENGNETLAQIILFKLFGTTPSNNDDQLGPYQSLVTASTGLTSAQINQFYNSSALGVPAGDVQATESPETGVSIVFDDSGIPHITGVTRAETEFGAGFAGAQERLWVMDLLRHLGRGELTSFAGGDAGDQELEQNLWRGAPYTQADLQAQVTALENDGTNGAQVETDITNYLGGVNAYISAVEAADDFPGEYDLAAQSIQPFTPEDLIAIADVIGALFGNGGGEQLQSALVKQASEAQYGTTEGDEVWAALREQNDPEATLTLHNGQTFPYGQATGENGLAMPDAGSVQAVNIVQNATGTGVTSSSTSDAAKSGTAASQRRGEEVRRRDAGRGVGRGVHPGEGDREAHDRPAGHGREGPARLAARQGLEHRRNVQHRSAARRGRARARPAAPRHVERAGRLRPGHRLRKPGRRVRPADRLLRPAAADARGDRGPRDQRARRVVRRPELLRADGPRPELRLVRDLRRAGHRGHVRRAAVQHQRHRPDDELDRVHRQRRLHADDRDRADRLVEPHARRRDRRRILRPGDVPDELRPGRVHGHDRRETGRVHDPEILVHARGRLGDRVHDVQQSEHHGHPVRIRDRRLERGLRLQLVLRQLGEHRVLQLGHEPAARRGHRPEPAAVGHHRRRVDRLEPDDLHRDRHPRLRAPQLAEPGLLRQLEQQTGPRLQRRRRQLQLGPGPTRRPAQHRDQELPGHRREIHRGLADPGDGDRRDHRPARLPRCCRCCSTSSTAPR